MNYKNIIKSGLIIIHICISINLCVAQSNAYTIKTVVIDAGHGGKDPGAVGKVAKEKDLTLAIALKTGNYIQKNIPDVKVIYTRSTDVFVELHKRAEIANKNNADVFISIHVNASTNKEAYGTDSWIMGLHKSKANLEVAKLENKVIMVEDNYSTKYEGMSPDSTEAIIIHTMMQSANIEHSARLASMVQKEFRERVGRKDRGVHTAPFMVLWKTTMPSILIESGFISNAEEEQFLITEQGQDYLASAIYRAFKDYKTAIETKSNVGVKQDHTQVKPVTEPLHAPPIPQTPIQTQSSNITDYSKPIDNINQQQPNSHYTIKDSSLALVSVDQKPASIEQTNTQQHAITKPVEQKPTLAPIQKTEPTQTQKNDITYSVQIAASKQIIPIKPENFKGFTNIYSISEDGWNKYYIGTYYSFKEISVPFQQIKTKYPEAFVVARKNGKKITIQEAKSITQ